MTSTREPIVRFERISKEFPGVRALTDVSLDLYPGEVHAIVGENGAGKSTLMNILAGVLFPSAGVLQIDGAPVRLSSPVDARQLGIAVVFQELSLCRNLTVGENVMLPALAEVTALRQIDRRKAGAQASRILDQLGMGDLDPATPLRDLSVAQMQLIEIARALAHDLRVLVLDEPNSALSPQESDRLFNIVRGLRNQGVAVVYISHHLDEVLSLADRITVMRDGALVETIDDMAHVQVPRLVSAMVGRDLGAVIPHALGAAAAPGAARITISDLSVAGQISNLDLTIAPGEILGVAGLPDSGKDVLADALFGLVPRGGTVQMGDRVLQPETPSASIAAGLVLIPADRRNGGALLSMTVTENIVSSTLGRFSLWGLLRKTLMRDTADLRSRQLDVRIAGLSQRMATLSGGNQQKVILARGMVANPQVLILHEPTRGIDVGAKEEIYRILKNLAAEGLAILMISSELPEIVLHTSRVMVMRGGRAVAVFVGAAITEEAIMLAATGHAAKAAE
jgi:ABC-type sugar transport system ATPase subunit